VTARAAIRLLGAVRVGTGDTEVGLRGHGARLLPWLALRPGRAWASDDLVDRLWPGGPPPTARTALQGQVAKLRGLLAGVEGAAIETVGSAYVLRVAPGAVDAARFDDLVEQGRASLADDAAAAARTLAEGLDLWDGPALANVRDDPALAVEAAALDARRVDAEDDLARALLAAGEVTAAVDLLERLVAAEPLRERRWAQLMVALHRDGRQAAALRAYQRAQDALGELAGLEPGRELRRIERAVLLQDPGLDAPRPWPAAATLPAPLVRVVGRDAERAELRERLRSSRLVTVVGPGGVGKTTVALDVAAALAPALADGAAVVDLAGAGPDRVPEVVAATFGVGEGDARDPLAQVAAALAGREALVVLDNCEHALAAVAGLALSLLRSSAGIRILATSQEPLRVAGEAVVALHPLSVPDEMAGRADVEASGAGALLAERLAALGRAPADETGWQALGAVARAAGGLPLALEVAAAWGRTEALAVVAERLGAGEELAAEPPAGAGRRGLGVALDAAAGRLGGPARRAYAAAGVFPAWFGPDALAAAAGLPVGAARGALADMVDVSLAVIGPADHDRFRLLPPVRRHALLLLEADGDAGEVHRGLLGWALALGEALDRQARGPDLSAAVARLSAELPTLRAVLHRSLDDGRPADALRLFERLAFCWASSPAAREVGRWGGDLLAHTGAVPRRERVRIEVLAMQSADTFAEAAVHLEAAERAMREADAVGDARSGAAARMLVAIGLGWRGERLDEADALVAEAREATLATEDAFFASEALTCQGLLALRRLDLAGGLRLLDAALAEHRATGTPVGVARVLFFIGFARRLAGDLEGARRAHAEARRITAGGRVTTWLRATMALGHTELAAGDLDAAAEAYRAAHARAGDVGDERIVLNALAGLAMVAHRAGDGARAAPLMLAAAEQAVAAGLPVEAVGPSVLLAEVLAVRGGDDTAAAAVLLGAATAVPPPVGVRLDAGATGDPAAVAGTLGERLGPADLARLTDEGRMLGLEAALAQARGHVHAGASRAAPPAAPGP
jgi:predicted ATPase/DNA-binding SARP family transcriptional activator